MLWSRGWWHALQTSTVDTYIDMPEREYYGVLYDLTGRALWLLDQAWFGGDDEFYARHGLNLFAACVAVLGTHRLGRELAGERVALLAMVLLVLSPRFYGSAFTNPKGHPLHCGRAVGRAVGVRACGSPPKLAALHRGRGAGGDLRRGSSAWGGDVLRGDGGGGRGRGPSPAAAPAHRAGSGRGRGRVPVLLDDLARAVGPAAVAPDHGHDRSDPARARLPESVHGGALSVLGRAGAVRRGVARSDATAGRRRRGAAGAPRCAARGGAAPARGRRRVRLGAARPVGRGPGRAADDPPHHAVRHVAPPAVHGPAPVHLRRAGVDQARRPQPDRPRRRTPAPRDQPRQHRRPLRAPAPVPDAVLQRARGWHRRRAGSLRHRPLLGDLPRRLPLARRAPPRRPRPRRRQWLGGGVLPRVEAGAEAQHAPVRVPPLGGAPGLGGHATRHRRAHDPPRGRAACCRSSASLG